MAKNTGKYAAQGAAGAGKTAGVLLAAALLLAVMGVGSYFLVTCWLVPAQNYARAEKLYQSGDYAAAETAFAQLGGYGDCAQRVLTCRDARAVGYITGEQHTQLQAHICTYGLSETVQEQISLAALNAVEQGDTAAALAFLTALSDAPEAGDEIREMLYQKALIHYNKGEFSLSDGLFKSLGDYRDSEEKIHEHAFTLSSETAPTCQSEGKREYTCLCGETRMDTIPVLSHELTPATCQTPATCTVCGGTVGEPAEHTYSNATCTKAMTCSACGQTEGKALGHNMVYCVCSRCGKVKLTHAQLQGTWVHSAGHYKMVVSGTTATVYWYGTSPAMVYTGEVEFKNDGFVVEGTYDYYDGDGNLRTAITRTRCCISKFTSAYFVDTFDDTGPYTWYKK